MKKALKSILAVVGALAAVVLLAILLMAEDRAMRGRTCSGLRVEFKDGYRLLDKEDVRSALKQSYGDFTGQRPDSVRLDRIEKILESMPVVRRAEAYMTPDDSLNVEIYQKRPVLKFATAQGAFYCDANGFAFPVQGVFEEEVPVMAGTPPMNDGAWVRKVISLSLALPTLLAPVERMEAAADGAIALKLADGRERILLGKPSALGRKLARANKYIRDIRPEKGPDWYSSVNVEYRGQVICRK
ncbi:MAG: hypothetical protein IJS07_06410 [Bacteroidales bacterium]|nr:hypothetical protein [Bacteroidales bacterium]